MNKEVFIKNNIPSSKNSKIATKRGVFHSKTVSKFLREQGIQHFSSSKKTVDLYKTKPLLFPVEELRELLKDVDYPIKLGFHFVRKTRAKADFHNLVQLPLDLLTAFDIIPDDNMDFIFPVPYKKKGKWYSYDKNNNGVFLRIIK